MKNKTMKNTGESATGTILSQFDSRLPLWENIYESGDAFLDFQLRKNGMINRGFNRNNTTAYRGEVNGAGSVNEGMALYGAGIYSATKRSYASQYGKVRVVSSEELPFLPFRLRSAMWRDYAENLWITLLGKENYASIGYFKGVIMALGYDGVTVGTKDDMIIVKYPEVQ